MQRLARLVVVASLWLGMATLLQPSALATPFSDVPANHWAYQYLQSLAADGIIDGYPDGSFKGDRPLTRYEMAVIVGRVLAKLQEQNPRAPSRADLDKLQKLVDALKDELDALGVRVSNVEDALGALDRRTSFAQSLSMHGVFLPNVTFRERSPLQRTVTNTTGAPVTTYYGVTVPPGLTPGNPNPSAVGSVDPYVDAFVATDDSNNPFTQANTGIQIRQDSRFSLAYQVNNNLTVSLPVHILNFEYGGEFAQQSKFDIEPGIDVLIARTGAVSNLDFKFGIIDDISSSRTGLAFRAPLGYSGAIPYETPEQPYQRGVSLKGTVGEGAFGLTDFEASFTRMAPVLINTQPGVTGPSVAPFQSNLYFYPVTPPQSGFTQSGAAGALRTDTFDAPGGGLAQVFLTQKAVAGSVYVSSYDGATYNAAGAQTGGAPQPLPAIVYNDAYNSVVFGTPLPAGAVVGLTYRGLLRTDDTTYQRYMVHARLNQKFQAFPGLEIGVTFNRIFDFDDLQTSGSGATGITEIASGAVTGNGLVSDTVLGIDFQAPLPYQFPGSVSRPILFGEVAGSNFTSDYRSVPATGDGAQLVGLRLAVRKIELSLQYQSVGVNFFDGAPFQYYGNPPALFASYRLNYLPDFFGFGNDLGINQQFDGQFTRAGLASTNTAGNPNLSFIFPVYNTLRAQGPTYFSAFAPNSRGLTASANAPIRVGDFNFVARGGVQHLEEIEANGTGAQLYGPTYATTARLKNDAYTVGAAFSLPVFGTRAAIDVSGRYESLKRNDATAFPYYPTDPATQTADAAALAEARAAFGRSLVSYYPNYVNMRHVTLAASASLPLSKDLTANASYSTQGFGGSYGTTFTQNISERKDYLTGGVTYTIPKTNSSLSFLARHYSYTDDVVKNYNFGQDRQDLTFTVRF